MNWFTLAVVVSALSFIAYGILSLTTSSMQEEFRRFGLEQLRTFTGVVQLLGGIGLLVGLKLPIALRSASAGIVLLMIAGLIVRFKVGDSWILCVPAFAYLLLNTYICTRSWH